MNGITLFLNPTIIYSIRIQYLRNRSARKNSPQPQFCQLHQQNDRLAVVLGVYFGPLIVVRNPLWCWVTVAILWNAGVLWCCGAGAGVYLFLLQRNLSEITDVGVCGLGKLDAS